MCDASFQMPIHHLHEPIDVFSEWLDECEAAEKRSRGIATGGDTSGNGVGSGGRGVNVGMVDDVAQQGYDFDSEEEDDLGQSSGLKGASSTSGGKKQQEQQHSLSSLGVVDSDEESD